MELTGKVAIVTGSTKGIGLAIAEKLVQHGTHVAVTARSQGDVMNVAGRLRREGGPRVLGIACDVRVEDEVENLVTRVVEEMGGLEILINNAGIGVFQSVEEMSPAAWRQVITTNLDSLFYTCHYSIPEIKKGQGGFIINIGSLAGKNAFPGGAAYNASKFGLIGFSEALMQEVRHDDIRVAYVMPGSVDTWFGGRPPDGTKSWKLSAQDVADVVVDTLQRDPRCLTSRIEMRPSKPPRK